MQLNKEIQDSLNKQINHEFHAEHIYLSMSAYFEAMNLEGFAGWMRKQADEERTHALKILDFINSRQGKVELEGVEKPKSMWKDPLHAVQDALAHERKVTGLIHSLRMLAKKENDQATEVFLNWFVEEQVEEEEQATRLVEKLRMLGDSKSGLFMLDQELGKRE